MFAFPVTLSAATDHAVTIGLSTLDGTATAANGDYVAVAGEVTIPLGATGGWIMVDVNGDAFNEDDETFTVALTSASAGPLRRRWAPRLLRTTTRCRP